MREVRINRANSVELGISKGKSCRRANDRMYVAKKSSKIKVGSGLRTTNTEIKEAEKRIKYEEAQNEKKQAGK